MHWPSYFVDSSPGYVIRMGNEQCPDRCSSVSWQRSLKETAGRPEVVWPEPQAVALHQMMNHYSRCIQEAGGSLLGSVSRGVQHWVTRLYWLPGPPPTVPNSASLQSLTWCAWIQSSLKPNQGTTNYSKCNEAAKLACQLKFLKRISLFDVTVKQDISYTFDSTEMNIVLTVSVGVVQVKHFANSQNTHMTTHTIVA